MAIVSQCTDEDCVKLGECTLGNRDRTQCKNWKREEQEDDPEQTVETPSSAPWHSDALSGNDLNLLSVHRRPHLVALIGPHNAGKSTLLAATHLSMLRTPAIGEWDFAGSLTLLGWAKIINKMQYPRDSDCPPGFPAHTPISADRVPGLLHYCFRHQESGKLRDVVFTDAPGEWFKQWAIHHDDTPYPGATWIADHADSFLFFVDSAELAGSEAGTARLLIESLSGRLAQIRNGRPVAIVWSKCDNEIPDEIRTQVSEILDRELPDAFRSEFAINATEELDQQALQQRLNSILEFLNTPTEQTIDFQTEFPAVETGDRFLCYRGAHNG
ncbi:MAG TPA: hypothetical protein DDW52_06635 [Planctomycetaceae bacterium]|nr:hypothetical protein [Planctomycetaceae bacterium]